MDSQRQRAAEMREVAASEARAAAARATAAREAASSEAAALAAAMRRRVRQHQSWNKSSAKTENSSVHAKRLACSSRQGAKTLMRVLHQARQKTRARQGKAKNANACPGKQKTTEENARMQR
jgi:hypothetical protein